MALVTLIVMEPGSEWPGQVGDVGDIMAIGNDEEGLGQRTQHRLALLEERGRRVRVAVLACNEATDPASVARRAEVAEALLTVVASVGSGRLVLSGPNRASARQRREILCLAGDLSQRVRGKPATVLVRFGGSCSSLS
jgi:hypothetical protein